MNWQLSTGGHLRGLLVTISQVTTLQVIDEGFVDLTVEVASTSRLDFVGAVDRLARGRETYAAI